MIPFLLIAALLLSATLALLFRPWWRRAVAPGRSRSALNAAIYRDQLQELDRDRADSQLAEADYQEARTELQRRLLEETTAAADTAGSWQVPRAGMVALLLFLPLATAGIYAWQGSPAGLDPMVRRDLTRGDIDRMVGELAAKLEKEPENYQGWAMLARTYKLMRRYDEALLAYSRAKPIVEKDPQLLADMADILGTQAGGDLTGQPTQLLERALALDPDHMQSLWMAGTAAFNRKDFAGAIAYWERAQRQLEPDSEDAGMLKNILAEARQKQGLATSSAAKAISGRVDLAAAVKERAKPDDTVFVVAREADGQPMPVAALRVRVKDLPLTFRLDDTDSLNPDRLLSSIKALRIEARVSKSGKAMPESGDLRSPALPAKPGVKGLQLVIDSVVE